MTLFEQHVDICPGLRDVVLNFDQIVVDHDQIDGDDDCGDEQNGGEDRHGEVPVANLRSSIHWAISGFLSGRDGLVYILLLLRSALNATIKVVHQCSRTADKALAEWLING